MAEIPVYVPIPRSAGFEFKDSGELIRQQYRSRVLSCGI